MTCPRQQAISRSMVRAAYGFVVFLSAACALVMEIVAGRLIAPYVGMSLYTWTAIIAVVLAGLSVGHWIGGVLAGPDIGAREGGRRVAWALALAAVSTLASLVLLRAVSSLLIGSGLTLILVIVLLTGTVFFLPSLFVGAVSPILTKLAIDAGPLGPGRIIGRMYAFGALGSIVGTLAAGYVFISWIGATGTVITVAAVYAVLAMAFFAHTRAAVVPLMVLAVAASGFYGWGTQKNAFQSPCRIESDYFCIRIADYSGESGRASALMILDHLVHSINDRDDPRVLYSPYIHFVDEVTKHRLGPRSKIDAFFIGGGGYSLPRAWAVDYPEANMMVAEIDPAVTAAARTHMWLTLADSGIVIVHQDARPALQALPRGPTFDVVLGDAFHDIAVPTHLVTREFHGEVAARLKPRGIYAVNVVDDGRDLNFLASLVKTLRADFDIVEVWKSLDERLISGRTNFTVIASRQPTPVGRLSSARGIERIWTRWPEEDLRRLATASRVPLLTDDFSPVDRLMSGLLLSTVE